jgi:hypothetical protein
MGHSAGAAHVAQYVGHPQFHVARGGGIAGAILVSGLFDPSSAEVNPPLQAVKRCPPFLQLRGHSHMSEVYAINTADTALTEAIRRFVR